MLLLWQLTDINSLYLLHKGSVTKSSQAVALAIIYYICSTPCTGSNVSFFKLSYYIQWWFIKYQESQTPTILLAPHYSDVIISAMASEITSLTIVYVTVYSGGDQRKHQSSASLVFGRGIHRWPHKGPVTRKMIPFDDVIMMQSISNFYDDAMAWTQFQHYWPFFADTLSFMWRPSPWCVNYNFNLHIIEYNRLFWNCRCSGNPSLWICTGKSWIIMSTIGALISINGLASYWISQTIFIQWNLVGLNGFSSGGGDK